jgi:hypothetical protein
MMTETAKTNRKDKKEIEDQQSFSYLGRGIQPCHQILY